MPFLAAAGPLIGGVLGATGAVSATTAGLIGTGLATAGALAGSKQATSQANQAAANAHVDINALDQQARQIAKQNALDSAALEKQMNPEVPQLRTAANNAVLNSLGGSPGQQQSLNFLLSTFGHPTSTATFDPTQLGALPGMAPVADFQKTALTPTASLATPSYTTPTLQAAIDKARSDLALGGQLSPDVAASVARNAAARAGTTGGGTNLGLGRDLRARDLGLTSYDIENQRLATALNAGGAESQQQQALQNAILQASQFNLNKNLGEANFGAGQNLNAFQSQLAKNSTAANYALQAALAGANFNSQQNQFGAQFGLSRDALNAQNFLNQYGLLNSYYNNMRNQDLAAAAYGQSITPPVVGLDPSSVANLAVGNQNVATQAGLNAAGINAKNNQGLAQFGGQLLGYGLTNGFFGGNNNGLPNGSTYANNPFASSSTAGQLGSSVFGNFWQ